MKTNPARPVALLLLAAALAAGCRPQSQSAAGTAAAPRPQRLVVFSQCNNAEPYRAAQNAEMQRL